jgi:hypothetical protein
MPGNPRAIISDTRGIANDAVAVYMNGPHLCRRLRGPVVPTEGRHTGRVHSWQSAGLL